MIDFTLPSVTKNDCLEYFFTHMKENVLQQSSVRGIKFYLFLFDLIDHKPPRSLELFIRKRSLGDTTKPTEKPLEKPVVEIIAMKINQLIKSLLQGNHIAEMMVKGLSLTPNPPRIPVFYKPVRRPIISGCDGPTERFSSFVHRLIQPWFFTMFQFPVIKPFGLENWAIFCCCCCVKIFAYKMHSEFRTDLEQTSQFSLKKCWAL